jgi:hypothetical protein
MSCDWANRENNAVTHAARYLIAEQTMRATNDVREVAKVLGHKSIKSTEHYIKPQPRGYEIKQGVESKPVGSVNGLVITKRGVIYFKEKEQ